MRVLAIPRDEKGGGVSAACEGSLIRSPQALTPRSYCSEHILHLGEELIGNSLKLTRFLLDSLGERGVLS